MGCRTGHTRHGKLAVRLHWRLPDGRVLRTQESLGASFSATSQRAAARDFADPIAAEMRARKFTRERYLHWFPNGAKAALFRRELGLEVASVPAAHAPVVTVARWYATWIERQQEPFVRASRMRDLKQAMTAYVLPVLGEHALADIRVAHVHLLRQSLAERKGRWGQPLSAKTIYNVVGDVFRTCFTAARHEGLIGYDPFEFVRWPRLPKGRPDPFDYDERERILEWFRHRSQGRFYALNVVQFLCGLRPSEAAALRVADFDRARSTLTISRSRNLGREAATKTAHSNRTILLRHDVRRVLEAHVDQRRSDEHLFLGRYGAPLNPSGWPKKIWKICLSSLGIRYRTWYKTRHTFISQSLTDGFQIFALAGYCGTSVDRIQKNYGKYIPREERAMVELLEQADQAKTQPLNVGVAVFTQNPLRFGLVPTGVEPVRPVGPAALPPSKLSRPVRALPRHRGGRDDDHGSGNFS